MKKIVLSILFIFNCAFSQGYQIGKYWDRVPYYQSYFSSYAESIADVGATATGFYIGNDLLVTNKHVCPDLARCKDKSVHFYYKKNSRNQNISAKVESIFKTSASLDLTIIKLKFINVDEENKPTPLELSNRLPYQGEDLFTIGFGIHKSSGSLSIDQGVDCKVISKTADVRLIKDPDTINPIPKPVYSILTGCDVSHGDSGSPVISKITGKVIGLLWSGKYPKSPQTSSEKFEEYPYEKLWSEMTLVVPASYIINFIN